MATKTIGASGDNYTTIAGFLADVTTSSGQHATSSDAIGEVQSDYADGSENIDFSVGDQTDVASVQIIGASGQRHGGDPGGAGATFLAAGQSIAFSSVTSRNERIAWLEIDFEGGAPTNPDGCFGGSGVADYGRQVDHCVIHSLSNDGTVRLFKRTDLVHHNLVIDIANTSTAGVAHLAVDFSGDGKNTCWTAYNTAWGYAASNSAVFNRGFYGPNNASATCRANVGSGTTNVDTDFLAIGTAGDNVSSDATATGTGSVASVAAADLFVSTAALDFRPKTGSAAMVGIVASADKPSDAGATELDTDLEGNTRSTDTDAGAFEYQSTGGIANPLQADRGRTAQSPTVSVSTAPGQAERSRSAQAATVSVATAPGQADRGRAAQGPTIAVSTAPGQADRGRAGQAPTVGVTVQPEIASTASAFPGDANRERAGQSPTVSVSTAPGQADRGRAGQSPTVSVPNSANPLQADRGRTAQSPTVSVSTAPGQAERGRAGHSPTIAASTAPGQADRGRAGQSPTIAASTAPGQADRGRAGQSPTVSVPNVANPLQADRGRVAQSPSVSVSTAPGQATRGRSGQAVRVLVSTAPGQADRGRAGQSPTVAIDVYTDSAIRWSAPSMAPRWHAPRLR